MSRLPSIRELFSDSFLLSNGIHLENTRASITFSSPAPQHSANSFEIKPYQRHRMSPYQTLILEGVYCQTSYPSNSLRRRLAAELNLTPRMIQVWFQNKRQKLRSIN
ncbi:hypothetical protein DSO57_1015643 [Entomophthora muscae]|uniref:Uncharacterized protein n=1 Tax=Entomophthora muscae TaxID=34485 RepID=A0ACC2STX7_9FUNG|nr:hypothetical protein DSO57_1015643 [Entomophthora muscae]